MMLIALLMIILISGFISAFIFEHVCRHRIRSSTRFVILGFIFDLLILTINLIGLRFCKGILWFTDLWIDFNCMSFTSKFALLSIIIAVILGIIFGIICRLMKRKHWGCCDED